jgi:hypothetical protein
LTRALIGRLLATGAVLSRLPCPLPSPFLASATLFAALGTFRIRRLAFRMDAWIARIAPILTIGTLFLGLSAILGRFSLRFFGGAVRLRIAHRLPAAARATFLIALLLLRSRTALLRLTGRLASLPRWAIRLPSRIGRRVA